MHVARRLRRALHVLELVDAPFGVALADLAQRLVLVPALAHVLAVDLVHRRLLRLVARLGEVVLQRLQSCIHSLTIYIVQSIIFHVSGNNLLSV